LDLFNLKHRSEKSFLRHWKEYTATWSCFNTHRVPTFVNTRKSEH